MFLIARRKKTKQGSALAYALVIMMAVSVILVSILTFISTQIKNAQYSVAREQAFQVAAQGIQFYKWYLAHETDGRTVAQVNVFWTTEHPYGVDSDYIATVADPSGGDMGTYRIKVVPPSVGSTIVTVESTGEMSRFPGHTRTIKVRFRRPSWSEYTVIANDNMRFGQGTEVYGKVESNLGIRFDGTAHNIVSSSLASYSDPDHAGGSEFGVHTHVNVPPATGTNDTFRPLEASPNTMQTRSDVFTAGRQLSVPSVDFNGIVSVLGDMKTQSQATGKYFAPITSSPGRQITLKTNNTFDTCAVNSYSVYEPKTFAGTNGISATSGYLKNSGIGTCLACSGQCLQNFPIPQNGVIFVEGNVWLSGQVNGRKVSIVAANLLGGSSSYSVFIPHNLLYTNYDGSDIIGVIAQQDVEIPRDSDTTLRIDGALVAQTGRVGRSYYTVGAYHDSKSSITVFGGIATNTRYGFAFVDGTGYANRNLYYDNNLLYYPPPYFPTGTQYQVDLWEEL